MNVSITPSSHRFTSHDTEGCRPYVSEATVSASLIGRGIPVALSMIGTLRDIAKDGSVVREWLLAMERTIKSMEVARRHATRRRQEASRPKPRAIRPTERWEDIPEVSDDDIQPAQTFDGTYSELAPYLAGASA